MEARRREKLVGKKVIEYKETVELSIAGRGSFLGVEDVINNGGYYTTTIQCIS